MRHTLVNTKLGPYWLDSLIGQGGMADVYRGYRDSDELLMAVKVLNDKIAQLDTFVFRFQREWEAVHPLNHPNIITMLDSGDFNDVYYLVMEYLDGGNLRQYIDAHDDKRVPPNDALIIIRGVLEGLAYAHGHGLVHRDVKPPNIMFRAGRYDVPILTDFGLVRLVDAQYTTSSGRAIGTPTYMSPEILRSSEAQFTADLYAVGIVLYEMLMGEPPYTAKNPVQLVMQHLHEPIPTMANTDIPPDIARVIRGLLVKDPDHRYQSARDVLDALPERV